MAWKSTFSAYHRRDGRQPATGRLGQDEFGEVEQFVGQRQPFSPAFLKVGADGVANTLPSVGNVRWVTSKKWW